MTHVIRSQSDFSGSRNRSSAIMFGIHPHKDDSIEESQGSMTVTLVALQHLKHSLFQGVKRVRPAHIGLGANGVQSLVHAMNKNHLDDLNISQKERLAVGAQGVTYN